MALIELETGEIATILDGLDQLGQFGADDPWYRDHLAELKKKLIGSVPPGIDRDELDF